jgi:hypothetical protein
MYCSVSASRYLAAPSSCSLSTSPAHFPAHPASCPVAEFIDPDCGDKVNFGMNLPYRPARHHGPAGRYDNSMPELTLSPSRGSMNSATAHR